MTTAELRFVIFFVYMEILLFTVILIFVLSNIWQILIVQKRWKTAPLLIFYVFAFVTLTERILNSLLTYELDTPKWVVFTKINCPTTKLAIGLIQIWMVAELALKMKVGIQLTRDPEA